MSQDMTLVLLKLLNYSSKTLFSLWWLITTVYEIVAVVVVPIYSSVNVNVNVNLYSASSQKAPLMRSVSLLMQSPSKSGIRCYQRHAMVAGWQYCISLRMKFIRCIIQGDHLSGKPGNVREFDSCEGNVRDFTRSLESVIEKNVVRKSLPKTVYGKLHICIHTGI